MTISRVSIVSFIALVLTAIALIPAGAHVFEMAGKMKLGRDAYFVVQGFYRGWAWFGIAIVGSFLACLTNVVLPGNRRDRLLSLFAALMIAVSLAIFFVFVDPANQITQNCTTIPANWKNWRTQWEWGHVASAVCILFAFLALAWSVATKSEA